MGIFNRFSKLLITIVASAVLILLGIVYFMITVWIIKIGGTWAGLQSVSGNTVVLTAGIVTAAAIVGSAIQQ